MKEILRSVFLKDFDFACINLETLFPNSDILLSIENTGCIKKKIDQKMTSFFIPFLKHFLLAEVSFWSSYMQHGYFYVLKNFKPLTIHEKWLLSSKVMVLIPDTSGNVVLISYKGETTTVNCFFAHCWEMKLLNSLI